ncbi:Glucose oxidase-like protein [Ceratobasidium theobromae]|uniref:Glucose oxidase-like protein n=2 Tax=Ceratobasidium theobromae TaxID=1582974 RepID=A0A5N5QDV5_9AGAM|nr:Glucose oxidase-like protein [Ceratobasidium theobromae]
MGASHQRNVLLINNYLSFPPFIHLPARGAIARAAMSRVLVWSALAFFGTASAKVVPRGVTSNGSTFAAQTFDYIIVGGGTAGLAVAARLSENPYVSVGVIEAGKYITNDPLIDTPQLFGQTQGNAAYDWMFQSTAQAGVNNRVIAMPRGKVLGGSSALNYMAFDRASKAEYDAWETLGSTGWNWNGILPFMKAAEKFMNTDPYRSSQTLIPSQGTTGPTAGSYNTWYSDVTTPYGQTLVNLGVPANLDPDSGDAFGVYNCAMSVNRTTGKRAYAASTYYAYNAGRPNLVVLTGAQATKIKFSSTLVGGNVVATGVSFVSNSATYTVTARKEVILSAGALQSPQLLELSGIGNPSILQQYGITPLVNLTGVGENLQDHMFIATSYELKPGKTTFDILRNNPTFAATAQAQYAATHDGIYAATHSAFTFIDLASYVNSTKIQAMKTRLDSEIAASGTTPLENAQFNIQKAWLDQKLGHMEIIMYPGYFAFSGPKANTSYISLLMALQHPFSRGNIHIGSSNPLVKGTYNPKYFSKSIGRCFLPRSDSVLIFADLDTLVEAVKYGLKVSQTQPLASMIVGRQDPPPGVVSDADIASYVKTYVESVYHPIGTAALAPRTLGGVVAPNLKVYGTTNVRVVDASVIPLHMGTHITRTIYGIAEMAANMIKSGN